MAHALSSESEKKWPTNINTDKFKKYSYQGVTYGASFDAMDVFDKKK